MWHARNSLGFCLIVNKKPLHLEKTISSVLPLLLLIYGVTNFVRDKKIVNLKLVQGEHNKDDLNTKNKMCLSDNFFF